jgi:hypothetical protein
LAVDRNALQIQIIMRHEILNRQLISQTVAVKFYMIQSLEAFITKQKGILLKAKGGGDPKNFDISDLK